MRWLFLALIGAFIVGDAFGMQMSLITGFSVKNAILYSDRLHARVSVRR